MDQIKFARRALRLGFLSSVAGAALLSVPAQAQSSQSGVTQAEEDQSKSNTIVVTARRREENLIDVPMAVSAYSAETLENSGVDNIAQIAQSAPSVTIEPSRATNNTLTALMHQGVSER